MNLKYIISLLFLLILTTGCSQNKSDEIKLFEKELNLFRYSLNKELNKLDLKLSKLGKPPLKKKKE